MIIATFLFFDKRKGGPFMLKLNNIVKDYVNGDNVTHALKGININFRRNEFVAILGQSGCGKTTLLNITGGLDRYTSGDLIIEGKSTKNYKDKDWDTYRNHSVGFVFQTYNLIYHQSISKNVELALTISGIKKAERKARAEKALELVGLGGLGHKKPNQLSGGQMQRVAIARALVNNPEIVMADEPTGALDSETSIQIMDLLKEVAKDRLVIMVTHNPELAEKYATRIITMKDGLITSDSNPYKGESEEERNKIHEVRKEVSKGSKKNTSMSFFTAMGLSFSNLLSKLKRTILVTIAGSIGIIGVSAVLAVSQGVRDYIGNMQDDMLSSYPLQVAEESVDMTSLLTGLSARESKDAFKFDPENPKIGLDSMVDYLMSAYADFTNVKTNVINEELIDFIYQVDKDAIYSIHQNYAIDPTNNIFGNWVSDPVKSGEDKHYETISLNGLTQRYIAELKTVKGFSRYASYVNLFTDFMNEFPAEKEYILSQYDLLGNSTLDETDKGITLVVDQNTTLTDLVLAQMGFFEHDEFLNIAKKAIEINDLPDDLSKEERDAKIKEIESAHPYRREFEYEDLLGKEFIYYPQDKIYENSKVADDKTTVSVFMIDIAGSKIYSINYNDEIDQLDATVISFKGSISYAAYTMLRDGEKPTEVTSLQDYVPGVWKAYDEEEKAVLTIDLTNIKLGMGIVTDEDEKVSYPFGSIQEVTTPIEGYHYQAELSDDMKTNVEANGGTRMKITGILRLKEGKTFGCLSRGVYFPHAFTEKFIADSNSDKASLTKDMKAYFGSEAQERGQFNAYVNFDYWDYTDSSNPVKKEGYATSLNGDLTSSFSDLFSAFTGGINYVETDKVHLRSVCGYKADGITDEDGKVLSYEFKKLPRELDIYPQTFEKKDIVTDHLDRWNSDENITVFKGTENEKILKPTDRSELSYTDTIKLIITVIDTLITTVTIALVSFTSLALVVSCFMIAVITYISVVERVKEIGIIRSVGGRKKDVSRLFITETFMTGLFSGIFGLIVTYVFEIVFNIVMGSIFGIGGLANLTILTALIMLAISILLSVLSGLIPSMKASHQDPVVALRSNE